MTDPAQEWVELYRGRRRSAQVVIRALIDAGLQARDARRLHLAEGKAQEGIVQVPANQGEPGKRIIEQLKKNFPHVFVVGSGKGD